MQENNQNSSEGISSTSSQAPVAMPEVQVQQTPLSQQTVSGVMGATRVINRSAPNIGMYVGIGVVIIAIVIAGVYFWVSRIEPGAAVLEETTENVVSSDVAEIDALTAEVDATLDFSEVDATLKGIDTELDAALTVEVQ